MTFCDKFAESKQARKGYLFNTRPPLALEIRGGRVVSVGSECPDATNVQSRVDSVKKKDRRAYRPITEDDKSNVLRVIALSQRDEGRPPTLRQIAASVDRSPGTVQRILQMLEDEKRLTTKGGARATFVPAAVAQHILRVSAAVESAIRHLPILGTVAAGHPIDVVDSDPETLAIPAEWVAGECYVLRISGESMIGDGIRDGDYVVVRATETVIPNAIHICWLPHDGATIKRVESKSDVTQLVASNRDFEPIVAPKKRRRRT